MPKGKANALYPELPKTPTGIQGFDDISGGGLPKGRPTLLCGGAGCGKTILAMEFLVQGARQFNEPGVFMAFEETEGELEKNFSSLGFDIKGLIASKRLHVEHIYVERSEIESTGEYDLDGLFIRIGHAVDSIGAKRIVLDTLESLFAGLPNPLILRAELRRLFRWLKDKGLTAVITAEKGDGTLTRHGLEEYVADCVIMLDHRVSDQVSTRRLRVVKYRGSSHGTNEFPFLIDRRGVSVLPITSLGLKYTTTTERVSTGIPRLDSMLGGKGYYVGSSVLVSGTAGTGKTSIASAFVNAACLRREKCLFFSFEESGSQIIRNMRSVGIDLGPWIDKGLLQIHSERPTIFGLEAHLAELHLAIHDFKPKVVVLDPISNLESIGLEADVKAMLTRLIDLLKMNRITGLFTSLTPPGQSLEKTEVGISSVADTWLLLRDIELSGERNRAMYILKSRGMAHSNQVREFVLSDKGIDLVDVYVGSAGVLTGSARASQEAQESVLERQLQFETEQKRLELESKRKLLGSQIAALQARFKSEERAVLHLVKQEKKRQNDIASGRREMARRRQADKYEKRREE